jgi:hypothetical protein
MVYFVCGIHRSNQIPAPAKGRLWFGERRKNISLFRPAVCQKTQGTEKPAMVGSSAPATWIPPLSLLRMLLSAASRRVCSMQTGLEMPSSNDVFYFPLKER